MSADTCLVCGAIIPEGRQVCPTCEKRAFQTGAPPAGYITSGDVNQMSGLRGQQIKALMDEHGTEIGSRTYIRFDIFEQLKKDDELRKYLAIPMYGTRIRCSKWRRVPRDKKPMR